MKGNEKKMFSEDKCVDFVLSTTNYMKFISTTVTIFTTF
jgi:hypothetical protein